MKAGAGGFEEGPPGQRSGKQHPFIIILGMRHVAGVSDTDPVYQVAVTKSICFVSALFNKLFILPKKGILGKKETPKVK